MKIEGGEITRKNKVAGKRALARVSKQARVQERACNTINLTILQTIVFSDASDEFSLLGKLLVIIESCLPQSFVFRCSFLFQCGVHETSYPNFRSKYFSFLFRHRRRRVFFLHAPFTQCKHLPAKRKGKPWQKCIHIQHTILLK